MEKEKRAHIFALEATAAENEDLCLPQMRRRRRGKEEVLGDVGHTSLSLSLQSPSPSLSRPGEGQNVMEMTIMKVSREEGEGRERQRKASRGIQNEASNVLLV